MKNNTLFHIRKNPLEQINVAANVPKKELHTFQFGLFSQEGKPVDF